MQHRFHPAPLNHAGSAAPDAPGEGAERHWHTVLGERPSSAIPDGDLDYFLRRPHAVVSAAAARPAVDRTALAAAEPTAPAMAAAFST